MKKCTFQFPIQGIPKSPEKKEISILMLILCLYDINDSRIFDMFTKGLYFNVPANKYFNKKYSNTL